MEDDDKKEPVTEPVKTETEVTPPVVTPPAEAHDGVKDLVNGLSERVQSLEETVRSLIPAERDSVPGKKPWTHRKPFGG